ncbi:MAG: DUF3857 domain-containing protein [Bacteroidales bacterium]|nr:DUF3857 domain-containing protein [Bacteroidales bacterium]
MKRIAIALLLFFPVWLMAQQGNYRHLIENSESSDQYGHADVLVLFDSTDVHMQATGLSYFNIHTLTKVLTTDGAKKNAIIKYGYDPLSAFVEIKKARIYRNNGEIEDLNLSDVLDYAAPARMIYWGAREIMLEVGRLEPGDAVELVMFKKGYTYALLQQDDQERYIPPMRGHFYDIVPFYSTYPVLEKTYILSVPKDKILQYEFYNGEAKSSVLLKDDRWVYSFTKKDIMPPSRESSMVAFDDVMPKLLLSTSPDWQAKSLWFYGVNEDYGSFDVIPEVQAKVNEILRDAKNETDSISLLTHWVADEVRYSGLSMGEGEGFTLHNAKMNFTDRCGVCKDKASILITMLRAAGFDSYPAMTMAGSRIDNIPADQFNHCVTVVKTSNDQYRVLDPTWVPFVRELWSSLEQQQNYLIGLPEGADLSITEISAPENHYLRINASSNLLNNGDLEGEFTVEAEGQSDASIRRMFTSNYKADWDKAMERELRTIASDIEIIEMNYGEPYKYQEAPMKIFVKYRIPNRALITGDEIIFQPVTISGLFKRAQSHLYMNTSAETRKYDFRDRCSRLVEIKETIIVPEGYTVKSLTDEYKSDCASIMLKMSQHGNSLKIKQSARFEKRIYKAEEWPDFKKVVEIQKDFMSKPLILIHQ